MYKSAYEMILTLPEGDLQHISCNLKSKAIYHKSKEIFSRGEFHNFSNATHLNSLSLIESRQYIQDEWATCVRDLFSDFRSCIPRKLRQNRNFIPIKDSEIDYRTARDDFHKCRLALELFILFHSLQNDLEWRNPNHFMCIIGKDCVVYKSWILQEVSHVLF